MEPREFTALIKLLDDEDREVLEHVSERILSLGPKGIPMLEAAWEHADNQIIQSRLEELIAQIQFDNLCDRLRQWVKGGCEDLQEAAVLIARFQYPELDEIRVNAQIDRLVQSVWIQLSAHLTPAEEVHIINRVIFGELGFKGTRKPEPDPDLAYINKVLDSRQGNSLGIGMLYVIMAKALDINIYGVNLPYHFIMCYCRKELGELNAMDDKSAAAQVIFYINPLLDGAPFSRSEITRYLDESQMSHQDSFYAPCTNRAIILSLIYNQMSCYEQREESEKAERMRLLLEIVKNSVP